MNDEQIEQLMVELSTLSSLVSGAVELLNNTAGYVKYLAELKGYGRQIQGMDAHAVDDDRLFWNRLHESDREDGIQGGRLGKRQLELPNTLTDEEKADLYARIEQAKARERLAAKRGKSRKGRKR